MLLLWFVAALSTENMKNVQIIRILKGGKNVGGSRESDLGDVASCMQIWGSLGV